MSRTDLFASHYSARSRIHFGMFIEELKQKLGLDVSAEHVVTVFGREAVAVEGVRGVSAFSETEIRLRARKCTVIVRGNKLRFVEFGGTESYIAGEIDGVDFA